MNFFMSNCNLHYDIDFSFNNNDINLNEVLKKYFIKYIKDNLNCDVL